MTFMRAGDAQRLNLLNTVQDARQMTQEPVINLEGAINPVSGHVNSDDLSDQPSRAVAQLISHGSWECPIEGFERTVNSLQRLLNYLRRLESELKAGTSHEGLIRMSVHEDTAHSWPSSTFIQTLTEDMLFEEESAPELISSLSRDLHNIIVIAHGSELNVMSRGMRA